LQSGPSPLLIPEAPLGTYPVTARAAGFADWVGEVRVKEKGPTEVYAQMNRLYGSLRVESTPAGADIMLDGWRVGYTPHTVDEVKIGNAVVELRKDGYAWQTLNVQIETKQESRLNFTLEKTPEPKIGRKFVIADLGLTLQPIAAGSFRMGGR